MIQKINGLKWTKKSGSLSLFFLFCFSIIGQAQQEQAQNPIIFADVPDMSMIRVGAHYYMSSTTMHMNPGVPIMKSEDLVNWQLLRYAYDTLSTNDAHRLENGKNAYGRGSWASSLRYHEGTYYLTTFAQTTGKTHLFSTQNMEEGQWKVQAFEPALHDNSLVFDKGKVFMIYGNGQIKIVELKADLSGIKPEGIHQVLIENASAPAGDAIMLGAEGSQLFKWQEYYYLFHIVWPENDMRTVLVHRAKNLLGPWEGKVVLRDKGVAQGGLIDTPDGRWFAYLFRDYGAVGRIPYWVPVQWKNGWPILGNNGKVPDRLELPAAQGLIPGLVASDEFERTTASEPLPLVWQWNHNLVASLWSLTERKSFLRLKTGRVDHHLVDARNTLTQRTIGPYSTAKTALSFSKMKDGDVAGLCLLQKFYGYVGIQKEKGQNYVVMVLGEENKETVQEKIAVEGETVFLKAQCNFMDRADTASFFYSLDVQTWHPLGVELAMKYTLPHFMGYRFGLFNFATQEAGGQADFDYFRISDTLD